MEMIRVKSSAMHTVGNDPTSRWMPSIPAELFTKSQTRFYADPVGAVEKALGV